MKADVVLAGVGGQGVLSVAAILAAAARRAGLLVKQGEIHGMSQRGGAVQATLRLGDAPIAGDLVGLRTADLIIGMEPLEALRQVPYLAPEGVLLTAVDPHRNIPNYPPIEDVLAAANALPRSVVIEAATLARKAGSGRAANVVMIGAASHYLPVAERHLAICIEEVFAAKGSRIVAANLAALRAGREAVPAMAR